MYFEINLLNLPTKYFLNEIHTKAILWKMINTKIFEADNVPTHQPIQVTEWLIRKMTQPPSFVSFWS